MFWKEFKPKEISWNQFKKLITLNDFEVVYKKRNYNDKQTTCVNEWHTS